jgi:hypothetical protein
MSSFAIEPDRVDTMLAVLQAVPTLNAMLAVRTGSVALDRTLAAFGRALDRSLAGSLDRARTELVELAQLTELAQLPEAIPGCHASTAVAAGR